MSLYQDAAGTIPALLPGDPVGKITRAAGTVDASQATQASKPTLARWPKGGRRNMLVWTEDLSQSAWTKQGTTASGMTVMDTLVTSLFAIRSNAVISPGTYTLSLELRPIGPVIGGALVFSIGSSAVATSRLNLVTGEVSGLRQDAGLTLSVTLSAQAGGWFRIEAVVSFTSALVYWDFRLADAWPIENSTVGSYTGTGTGGIEMRNLQLEEGNLATPYQRVATANDVTQMGLPPVWHLYNDGGDSINVTLPAGDCGLAWVDSVGEVSTTTVTSDGTTPISLLRTERMADVLIRQGALSPVEIQELTAYWEARYK